MEAPIASSYLRLERCHDEVACHAAEIAMLRLPMRVGLQEFEASLARMHLSSLASHWLVLSFADFHVKSSAAKYSWMQRVVDVELAVEVALVGLEMLLVLWEQQRWNLDSRRQIYCFVVQME